MEKPRHCGFFYGHTCRSWAGDLANYAFIKLQ